MSGCNEENDVLTILRVVPYDSGFHFTTPEGLYTGITATCLEDFLTKLKDADMNSIAFHYHRGDFQKWIEDTLGDKKLANQLSLIKTGLTDDQLKEQLLKILHARLQELESLKWIEIKGI